MDCYKTPSPLYAASLFSLRLPLASGVPFLFGLGLFGFFARLPYLLRLCLTFLLCCFLPFLGPRRNFSSFRIILVSSFFSRAWRAFSSFFSRCSNVSWASFCFSYLAAASAISYCSNLISTAWSEETLLYRWRPLLLPRLVARVQETVGRVPAQEISDGVDPAFSPGPLGAQVLPLELRLRQSLTRLWEHILAPARNRKT